MSTIDKTAAYNALKHEAERHELSLSVEAYERAARIIDQMPIIATVRKMKRCKYCEDRAYTKKPFIVITPTGQRIDILFNFCPNCGRDMRKGGAR